MVDHGLKHPAHILNKSPGPSAPMATVGASPITRCRPEEVTAITFQELGERCRWHDPPVEFVKNFDREPCWAEKTKGSSGACVL